MGLVHILTVGCRKISPEPTSPGLPFHFRLTYIGSHQDGFEKIGPASTPMHCNGPAFQGFWTIHIWTTSTMPIDGPAHEDGD